MAQICRYEQNDSFFVETVGHVFNDVLYLTISDFAEANPGTPATWLGRGVSCFVVFHFKENKTGSFLSAIRRLFMNTWILIDYLKLAAT